MSLDWTARNSFNPPSDNFRNSYLLSIKREFPLIQCVNNSFIQTRWLFARRKLPVTYSITLIINLNNLKLLKSSTFLKILISMIMMRKCLLLKMKNLLLQTQSSFNFYSSYAPRFTIKITSSKIFIENALLSNLSNLESVNHLNFCKKMMRQERAAQQCALFYRMEIAMMTERNSQTIEGVDRTSRTRISIILRQS